MFTEIIVYLQKNHTLFVNLPVPTLCMPLMGLTIIPREWQVISQIRIIPCRLCGSDKNCY